MKKRRIQSGKRIARCGKQREANMRIHSSVPSFQILGRCQTQHLVKIFGCRISNLNLAENVRLAKLEEKHAEHATFTLASKN